MGASKRLFEQVQNEVLGFVSDLENGELSHIDFFIKIKEQQKQCEEAAKTCKAAIDENIEMIASQAKEYPEGKNGYQFEVRNGSRRWDFKGCPLWDQKKEELKSEEDKLKLAWNSSMKGILQADENGEEIILPNVKTGNPTVILKKKK